MAYLAGGCRGVVLITETIIYSCMYVMYVSMHASVCETECSCVNVWAFRILQKLFVIPENYEQKLFVLKIKLPENDWFLGVFGNLRKATVSFVMSVRKRQLGSHCTDFYEIWYLLRKFEICRENPSVVKIWQSQRIIYIKTYVHLWSYIAEFYYEWEMFDKTHFVFSNFSPKVVSFMR